MTTPAAEAYAKANPPYPAPVVHPLGRELTHADRCDWGACGAAAYVRTESYYSTNTLLWCGHHYAELESHFSPETHAILDERPFLKAAVLAQATRKEIH